ncbi:glycosyltransferase family 2 protein [Streptosporangium sandarakinum]|uniref:glycosyltransferase family 2 protein n=1 Tax=Streptosporangium sandarakinum TaxID=1260955 RepID=UPI003D8AD55B
MDVKVSVVVPVRDPGTAADACVRSLLAQSMAPEEYEVVFADTGPGDGIQRRLEALSAARPNVRVLHLGETGSPMRGRNIGMAVAQGEYVYLMEQTDRLERTALERMYRRAVQTDADVLLGRLVAGRMPPSPVFEADRDRADILKDRLLSALTPHKLYRRAFLDAEALAFPDPGGRLAEETFVLRAYLRAKVVAVLADEVCCHVAERPEPPGDPYVQGAELRELLDVIDAELPPGRRRDRMYAHWLRASVLRRLGGGRFVTASARERAATFTTLRELVIQRFPPHLDRYLPVHLRVRAALLRAGRLDRLLALAEAMRGTHLRADLREAGWRDGAFEMALTVEIMRAGGEPMRFVPYGETGLLWDPPAPLDVDLPPELVDVTRAVSQARVEVYIRHPDSGLVHALPVTSSLTRCRHRNGIRLQAGTTARLEVDTAALGRPLPAGPWEVHARMHGGAHRARARVTGVPGDCVGDLAGGSRRLVVPWWSEEGELGVCVEPRSFPESIVLVSTGTTVIRDRGQVFVVVPVPYVPPSGGPPAELALRRAARPDQEVCVPALIEPGVPGRHAGRLVARVPIRLAAQEGFLCPGEWLPFLRLDGGEEALRFRLRMGRTGRVEVGGASGQDAAGPRYPLARRAVLRVPGVRGTVRLARTVRRHYLPS